MVEIEQFTMRQHLVLCDWLYCLKTSVLSFEFSSHINAPVEDVFAFHERPDALQRLNPPRSGVVVLTRTGGLEVGAKTELLVPIGPFKFRWLAHHIAYEKNKLFIDEQRQGPFAAWVHAHIFTPEDGGTRLTDSVEFSLPGGITAEKFAGWLVKRKLRKMFEYRHEVTRRACVII